ncbi:hypothetical protein H0H81_009778 [Sphagnurus paluster]|uniref:Protein kinase domain-containing protein n=1 Tax=Sphagnurus paluster TaxID=117069 RepID=A0A9P7GJF5_9AGAR|nr:hypothetical protein H0H81_009778 [Sphagnurus paluster]
MVNNDVTFGCLNAGSYQIYLHRDRITQTVSITDILRIDAPECFKMLTGFLIAILRDAEDRFRLLWKSKPDTWSKVHPFENPDIITELTRAKIFDEASKRAWAVMSPVPAGKTAKNLASSTFVPDSPYERITMKDLRKSTSSKKQPFNGDPFLRIRIPVQEYTARGTLWVSGNEFSGIPNTISSTLLVKHANDKAQLKALRREFQVLHDLRAAGVLCVPIPIGLFRHVIDPGSGVKLSYASLVLEDVGNLSIAAHKRSFSPILIEECLGALKQIHNAGYCLRDISLADIIIRAKEFQRDGCPKVSIVAHSLSRAYIPENSWVMDEDIQFLLDILQNPLKRRVRDWDDPETDDDINSRAHKRRALNVDKADKGESTSKK